MKKQANKERERKVWCYGKDLMILSNLSDDGEEWEYIQRLVDEPIGDCYLVSNMGRVYNTSKKELCPLYPDSMATKYDKVSLELCPSGHENVNVHRLVALAFVTNPDPARKVIVHHIDGNRQNNCADNLLWVSPSEHRTLHSLKKHDLSQYITQVSEWRTEQPIKKIVSPVSDFKPHPNINLITAQELH